MSILLVKDDMKGNEIKKSNRWRHDETIFYLEINLVPFSSAHTILLYIILYASDKEMETPYLSKILKYCNNRLFSYVVMAQDLLGYFCDQGTKSWLLARPHTTA